MSNERKLELAVDIGELGGTVAWRFTAECDDEVTTLIAYRPEGSFGDLTPDLALLQIREILRFAHVARCAACTAWFEEVA